jgi:hypothetical protein
LLYESALDPSIGHTKDLMVWPLIHEKIKICLKSYFQMQLYTKVERLSDLEDVNIHISALNLYPVPELQAR